VRVCYFSSGLGIGGAEFALLRLCRALRAKNIETTVVSVSGVGALGEQFTSEGIAVMTLDMARIGEAAYARRRTKHHLGQYRPQLVHGWMYHGNLAASLLSRVDGVQRPVLWGIRQSLLGNRDKLSTRLLIRLSAALSARPDAIVYNSSKARLEHERIGFSPRHAHVIGNGFDAETLRFDGVARTAVRAALGLAPDSVVIGHVARFHPSKDHVGFLRAFARVAQDHIDVRAVLAGDRVDWTNGELKLLIGQLGITDRVRLLGLRTDIAELMSSFDVFCSSSSGMEGFPNVVAEAMCCQLPCVATDVGDTRTIIGSGGEVVSAGGVQALADALDRMIRMPPTARMALGLAAREHIATHYSAKTIAEKYAQLYESMVSKNTAASCAA
jgi:glycosyltransferase involved in cell wall biosynthesis